MIYGFLYFIPHVSYAFTNIAFYAFIIIGYIS